MIFSSITYLHLLIRHIFRHANLVTHNSPDPLTPLTTAHPHNPRRPLRWTTITGTKTPAKFVPGLSVTLSNVLRPSPPLQIFLSHAARRRLGRNHLPRSPEHWPISSHTPSIARVYILPSFLQHLPSYTVSNRDFLPRGEVRVTACFSQRTCLPRRSSATTHIVTSHGLSSDRVCLPCEKSTKWNVRCSVI